MVSLDRDEDSVAEETVSFAYDGNLPTSVTFAGTVNQTVSNVYRNLDLAVTSTSYAGVTKAFSYDNDGLLLTAGSFTINRDAATGRANYVTDKSNTDSPKQSCNARKHLPTRLLQSPL